MIILTGRRLAAAGTALAAAVAAMAVMSGTAGASVTSAREATSPALVTPCSAPFRDYTGFQVAGNGEALTTTPDLFGFSVPFGSRHPGGCGQFDFAVVGNADNAKYFSVTTSAGVPTGEFIAEEHGAVVVERGTGGLNEQWEAVGDGPWAWENLGDSKYLNISSHGAVSLVAGPASSLPASALFTTSGF
jgi:hypothetical protein